MDEDEEEGFTAPLQQGDLAEARDTSRKELLLAFVRWAKAELVGIILLFAVGLALGYIFPVNPNLAEPYARISNVIGYIYFLAWTVSFYPQIFENRHRGTTIGLSLDFEIFNLIGFCCYSAFSLSFRYSDAIQAEYAARHNGNHNKVEVQDCAFAVHAVGITLVTIAQMFYYDGRKQRISWPSAVLMACMLLSIAIYAAVVASSSDDSKGVAKWFDFLYFVSYVKLLISTVKGIPQFINNYKRKSTEGWNIHNVLLDATGGSLSLLQLLLDCYDTNDWSGIRAYPLKFGLSLVSLTFDIIFSLQHFVWYRDPKKQLNYDLYNVLLTEEDWPDTIDAMGEKAR